MKKFSVVLLIILMGIFINLSLSLRGIKTVHATSMHKTLYSSYVNVSGEFENQNKTDIKLSYPVYVKDVYVKENQFVNQGQALFSIDLQRMESAAGGNIDREILEQLSYEDLSKLAVRSENMDLNNIPNTVYATQSGIISGMNIYPGAAVLQNKTLLSITETDNILAKFTMSQIDYGKISVGDSVDITPVAFSNTVYTGKIIDKNAVVKKQTTAVGSKVVVDVFAEIENPDNRVSGGLQINGKVQNGAPVNINTIDYKFIYQDDAGEYVYILQNGRAHKVYVDTGIETENYTEILTEFSEDTIFVSGEISEGCKVIITE